jgi:carboxyl-terminal processing protease
MVQSRRLFTAITLALFASVVILAGACAAEKPAVQQQQGQVVLPDGSVATATALPDVPPPDEVPEGLEPVWEAYSYLVREYVERAKVDPDLLAEGAIRGMLDALADKHTAYIEPATLRLEQSNFQGKFEGIGASVELARDGRHVLITAPLPDSPAERAGVKAGDKILKVDGVDAEGWSVIEAVNKIRGEKGTTVQLLLERIGETQPVSVAIVRGTIEQPSVRGRLLEDTPYGVIKVTQFTAETHREMVDEIDNVLDRGARGIVLDLRQNPGGLLTVVVDMASEFLESGLVTYEVDGRGNRQDWPVKRGGQYQKLPLVVLVDGFSASGSEVLAGALQDHGRAVVIGTKTFGKGSVNFLRELSNGGGLYMTVARWYTPNGRLLEEVGVPPDVVVDMDTASADNTDFEDRQMTAALKQLDFQTGLSSALLTQNP